MNSKFNIRIITALLCSLILAGAVYVWAPQFFPVDKEVEVRLDRHMTIFRELQITLESFRDMELHYRSYMLAGQSAEADAFNDASRSIDHHMSMLRGMTQSDPLYGDKMRSLSTRISLAMDQMKQAVAVPRAKDKKDTGLLKTVDDREIKEIGRQLSRMEEDELQLLKTDVMKYNALITSGPTPWIALIVISGLFGILFLSFSQRKTEAASEEQSSKVQVLTRELEGAKEQLERLTHIDPLTEVLNLRGLEQVLKVEESRIGRGGTHLVAILVNCDDFKRTNERLGEAVGDVVLKDIAKRIGGALRPSDHVARIGGDEFLILLPETQLAYGLRIAERIRIAIADNPLHSAHENITLTVSIGVAMLPPAVKTAEEAISVARAALVRSKQLGKNRVSLARDGGSGSEAPKTASDVINRLLDIDNFRTVFQPIIDLSTEQVAGFEILTRGPDGAFENPADLFRLCIENNVLTRVDMQCLKLCLEMSSDIANNMRVHINLFPSTILETPIEELIECFPKDRAGRTYCLEISEQHFMGEPGYLREHVQKLRSAGVIVAIDDIGFGRNSLDTLILLEPDVVKVDRKYVEGIAEDKAKVRLLKRLSNVAKSLGAEVVAEGVESRTDVPVLQELGITFGQGFLWGELLEVLPQNPHEQRTLFNQLS